MSRLRNIAVFLSAGVSGSFDKDFIELTCEELLILERYFVVVTGIQMTYNV
jgi:hypothetical protein